MRAKRHFLAAVYLLRKHAADHWMRGGMFLPEDYALALPVIMQQLAAQEGALSGSIKNASVIASQCIGQLDEQELAARLHFDLHKDFYREIFANEKGVVDK